MLRNGRTECVATLPTPGYDLPFVAARYEAAMDGELLLRDGAVIYGYARGEGRAGTLPALERSRYDTVTQAASGQEE